MTLAALRDDAPVITTEDLKDLTNACKEFDEDLQNLVLKLTGVSIVIMSSRSLEHQREYLRLCVSASSSTLTRIIDQSFGSTIPSQNRRTRGQDRNTMKNHSRSSAK